VDWESCRTLVDLDNKSRGPGKISYSIVLSFFVDLFSSQFLFIHLIEVRLLSGFLVIRFYYFHGSSVHVVSPPRRLSSARGAVLLARAPVPYLAPHVPLRLPVIPSRPVFGDRSSHVGNQLISRTEPLQASEPMGLPLCLATHLHHLRHHCGVRLLLRFRVLNSTSALLW